jgi:carbon monoxide dehydrogenase subunit G
MSTEIAERQFEVKASQDRVWRLIGKVIFSCLPGMEQVEFLDENNFRARLRVQVPLKELTMRLKGEMVDMSPSESFAVKLDLEGLMGFLRMSQKVAISMTSIENSRTAVVCKATAENLGIFFRILLLRQARNFAKSTFDAIEKRLKDLA